MHNEPLYKLHAETGQQFSQTGERARLERYIERVCPALSAAARQRITRQIARGLNVFGREAINLGIEDLAEFESRLKNTNVQAKGYRTSLKSTVQNAVRYLHVAAREGTADDLRAVLDIKRQRRNQQADAEALPVTPGGQAASPARGETPAGKTPGYAGSWGQKGKQASPTPESGADVSPLAEIDAVIDPLAALQTRIGASTDDTEREVIALLVETFSETAVLRLLASVPDGYCQPVQDGGALPDNPSVGQVARRVLVETLVGRRARLAQT